MLTNTKLNIVSTFFEPPTAHIWKSTDHINCVLNLPEVSYRAFLRMYIILFIKTYCAPAVLRVGVAHFPPSKN